jgi:perosamine synthetase
MTSKSNLVPLSLPNLIGNEWKYVKDCLDTGWISSAGSYVNKFERMVADYTGMKHGIAVMNGTAGLHISLLLSGVEPGDCVIVPNLTFVASANAIKYVGAEPIFIDSDPHTWQMDLALLEEFLETKTVLGENGLRFLKKNNKCVRLIMPVHVQGNIFDFDRFILICKKFNISFIEDAAEALGSKYKGKFAGTFGDLGVFSFNGNKIISSGGGGVIVTNNDELARKAKHITTTAKTDPLQYYHDEVGYNFRLVNVLAAIGCAQMELLNDFVIKKQQIGDYYRSSLSGIGDIVFQEVNQNVSHNNWLFTIKTTNQKKLLEYLNSNEIQSRPFWMPMVQLPMYKNDLYISKKDNAKMIHNECLSIPCSTGITEQELEKVVFQIKKYFNSCIK